MNRERALKVVLVVVGLLFIATVYPMFVFVRDAPALSMMLSLYVTLGIFLLLAARDPGAHRSLIAFAAWSSLAHGVWMGTQALMNMVEHKELVGVGILLVIGVVLLVLAPAKRVESVIRVEGVV
jgi:hypothetical protein